MTALQPDRRASTPSSPAAHHPAAIGAAQCFTPGNTHRHRDRPLEQCFRLGPKGIDAGVFAAALEMEIHIETASPEVLAYRLRLDNDPELRLGLIPMFEGLKRSDSSKP